MLSYLRRRPGVAALLLFSIASICAIILLALGIGPDRRVRLELGITLPISACSPDPARVRNPPPGSLGSWSESKALPHPRDEVRAVATNGRVYVGTGVELKHVRTGPRSVNEMYAFDPGRGRYEQLPDAPTRVDHALLVADDDFLYLVGGFVDGVATGAAWRYSLDERRWSALAPMPTARGALGGAVIGDSLYAVAGTPPPFSGRPIQPYGTLEILDLRSGRWRAGPSMPFPRHHVGAAALDGALYVVGGRGRSVFSLAHAQRFDVRTGAWESLPPLPQASGALAAAAVGGELLAIGGGDDAEGWVTGATWAFDPARDEWRRLPNLIHPRHGHGAAALGSTVFVFGGSPCFGAGETAEVEQLVVR